MGYYIDQDSKGNRLPSKGKAGALMADGAVKIAEGILGVDIKVGFIPNLVVVVQNKMFDAAAYAYDEDELKDFLVRDDSLRKATVLIYEHAQELSGYTPD